MNHNIRHCFKYLGESKNLHVTLWVQVYIFIGLTTLNTEIRRNFGVMVATDSWSEMHPYLPESQTHMYLPVWSAGGTWQLVGIKTPWTHHLDWKH